MTLAAGPLGRILQTESWPVGAWEESVSFTPRPPWLGAPLILPSFWSRAPLPLSFQPSSLSALLFAALSAPRHQSSGCLSYAASQQNDRTKMFRLFCLSFLPACLLLSSPPSSPSPPLTYYKWYFSQGGRRALRGGGRGRCRWKTGYTFATSEIRRRPRPRSSNPLI